MKPFAAALLTWIALAATLNAAEEPLRIERIQPQATVTPHALHKPSTAADRTALPFFLARADRIEEREEPMPPGRILRAEHGRMDISPGDVILIQHPGPLPTGTTVEILRPGAELKHPTSGEPLGRLIRLLGSARVTGAMAQGSLATVIQATREIQTGDQVALPRPVNTDFTIHDQAPYPLSGVIAHMADDQTEAGAGQVVVVSLGRRERAVQGLTLPIYRISPEGMEQRIGSAILFSIGARASLALLETSLQPVHIGDTLRAP
ncbi:MAG: hypothetical protein HQL96_15635 [Magnetococcales bacterium]|nr:hypothetical protein [Magnetococcales bacterium]